MVLRRLSTILLSTAALLLFPLAPVQAGDIGTNGCTTTWTNGSGTGLWASPANWDHGVPDAEDTACLPPNSGQAFMTGVAEIGPLQIGAGAELHLSPTGCPPSNVHLTLDHDSQSAGSLILENPSDACGGEARVSIAQGAQLINSGIISVATGRANAALEGSILNTGSLVTGWVRDLFTLSNGTFDNQGHVHIDGAAIHATSTTTFENNAGGEVTKGRGGLLIEGGKYIQRGGVVSTADLDTVAILDGSKLELLGDGSSHLLVTGEVDVLGESLRPNQTLDVSLALTCPTGGAQASFADNFTNYGTINFTYVNWCGGGAAVGLKFASGKQFTNRGEVNAKQSYLTDLFIEGALRNLGAITAAGNPNWSKLRITVPGDFVNEGSITLADSATLTVNAKATGAVIDNKGTMAFSAGAVVNLNAAEIRQTAGTMHQDGLLYASGMTGFNLKGGVLRGGGEQVGPLRVTGGTFAPLGEYRVSNGDVFSGVTGDFTIGANGTLAVRINGTSAKDEYDRLAVAGSSKLDGTLTISTGAGYVPSLGSAYTVVDSGTALTGKFARLTGAVSAGPAYQASYTGSPTFNVFLTAVAQKVAPGTVTSLAAKSAARGALTLSWKPPKTSGTAKVTSYKLVFALGTKKFSKTTTRLAFTQKGLASGKTYTVLVSAVSADGTGKAVSVKAKVK